MGTKQIKERLWNSLDMAVVRRDVTIICIGAAVGVLLLFLSALVSNDLQNPELPVMAAVMAAIFILPALGYGLWVSGKIFRCTESYTLYRAKLASPHGSRWLRGVMYFTVVLEDAEGKFIINTRPIFESYGRHEPLLENYLNKTVTIAYNEETEMVVVIG